VAFVAPSISRIAGGLFEIERRLAQCLAALPATRVSVWSAEDEHTVDDLGQWLPIEPRVLRVVGPRSFAYMPKLQPGLVAEAADVAHLHALWMYTSIAVWGWRQHTGRPYLTTINGMLDEWALRHSTFKKRVALALYERRALEAAGCIQVNSEPEMASARTFGLRNPICIIPNGVDPVATENAGPAPWEGHLGNDRRVLLYLGRLHPKKGLENLLRGLAIVRADATSSADGWVVVIAGWDQGGHEARLRILARELGLADDVFFAGPVFGAQKAAALTAADACVLPSVSEGLPMAILEGWGAGKPVVMTDACNLPGGFQAGAALRIAPDPESIAHGLRDLWALSDDERTTMGQRGLELVTRRYSWETVARQVREVYAWLTGAGPMPATVSVSC
jgi:poly(glycerol-phosphate) alpha-glucosyltransferase